MSLLWFFRMMNQPPSFANIPASSMMAVPPAGMPTGLPAVSMAPQYPAQPVPATMNNSNQKNGNAPLPPPPYKPGILPRPAALPPVIRPEMVPVGAMPSLPAGYPILDAAVAISRLPGAPPIQHGRILAQSPDSNALDLSGPAARKRKSDSSSSCSSDEDMPSPPISSKYIRDSTGSPVQTTQPLSQSPTPKCSSPTMDHQVTWSSTMTVIPTKGDINGNTVNMGPQTVVTGMHHDSSVPSHPGHNGEPVESSTGPDISAWDVDSVVRFISTIPGCQEYAEVRTKYLTKYMRDVILLNI